MSPLTILLINPPVSKPCEPPAGLSQLAGMLKGEDIPFKVIDANLEGMLYLMDGLPGAQDTWTRRANKHRSSHLVELGGIDLYKTFDRYKRAVSDLNRLLEKAASRRNIRISLEDYEDPALSPAKSSDLLYAAGHPKENPFYTYLQGPFRGVMEREEPCFVGFSLSYLSQALCTFAMVGFVKNVYPDVKIILGGGLVTSWMKSPAWQDPFGGLIDHLVCGPGEQALLSILGKALTSLKNYAPVFYFGETHDPKYLAPGLIMPYSTSSGCYWGKCTFCPERAEQNAYVQRPPRKVAAELADLVREVRPILVHLTDNAVSPAVLRQLTIRPPGAPWYGFVRVTEQLADDDFCMALRRSGCVLLKLGVESGDQDVLDAMSKGNETERTGRVLKSLHRAGIATYAYLLFGTPHESRREALNTLDFVVNHSQFIDFMNVAVFNLPLLSPDARGLQQSRFYAGDLSLYTDFVHPRGWDRRAIRGFLDREFKRHPAIKPILQRQPPFFTSNHAPLFSKLFADYEEAVV